MIPKNPNPDDRIPVTAVYLDNLVAQRQLHEDLAKGLGRRITRIVKALDEVKRWANSKDPKYPKRALARLQENLQPLEREMELVLLTRESIQFTERQNRKR